MPNWLSTAEREQGLHFLKLFVKTLLLRVDIIPVLNINFKFNISFLKKLPLHVMEVVMEV